MIKKTSLLKKGRDIRTEPFDNCHGGNGSISFKEVLGKDETTYDSLNFIHDDILPPGTSIGEHIHENDEEYYYIISGTGTMYLDGDEYRVEAGDITAVFPGGTHSLKNDSSEDLHIIVISVMISDRNIHLEDAGKH